MSESGDYEPVSWARDFGAQAKQSYQTHSTRQYTEAVETGKDVKDLIPDSIETDCERPLVILGDVTGSMGERIVTIVSKLGYLVVEGKEYLGKDSETAFGAVGDANPTNGGGSPDKYPVQIRPFAKGEKMKTRLHELLIEKGGGGQAMESYELMAVYCARKVKMPKATLPICIFIGDEAPYPAVKRSQASDFFGIKLEEDMPTEKVFTELKRKFAVYIIRAPYQESSDESKIHRKWCDLLGEDRVSLLPDSNRVLDVIFGILARETGRIDYFRDELEERQLPDKDGEQKVATVYRALETIHHEYTAKNHRAGTHHSSVRGVSRGPKGKSLI
jgi:hypothetical protein